MKSPWKMLGRLISRGRSPEPKRDTTAGERADEQELLETPVSSLKSVLAPGEPQINEVQPVKEKSLDEAGSGGEIAAAMPAYDGQVAAHSLQSVKPRRVLRGSKTKEVKTINAALPVLRTKRPDRQKRISTERAAQNAGAASAREMPSLPAHDQFHAEVADVDAEIGTLSRQLAEKLIQQNAQLRKMLERFGVS